MDILIILLFLVLILIAGGCYSRNRNKDDWFDNDKDGWV